MIGLFRNRVQLRHDAVKRHYDVVIIGGGGHGLATAYYLARVHGVRDVAVLERSYIGAGGTGRNTTIVRSNYKAPETIAFYKKSHEMFLELAQELKLLKLGTVSLDGTHIRASASKDKNVTYERAQQLRTQLRQDVNELLQQAERAAPFKLCAASFSPFQSS